MCLQHKHCPCPGFAKKISGEASKETKKKDTKKLTGFLNEKSGCGISCCEAHEEGKEYVGYLG